MSNDVPKPAPPDGVPAENTRPDLGKLAARLPPGLPVYACLQDLFEHGPIGTRGGPAVDHRPSRSDITHYLAKWSRAAGLTQEAALEWLGAYALDVLAAISTSSAGAIRHNTKGIVKFVYQSGYPFNCAKEQNPLHCRCDPQCPVYAQPEQPLPRPAPVPAPARPGIRAKRKVAEPAPEAGEASTPQVWQGRVKDQYRERHEKALIVIQEMRAAGHKPGAILEHLNRESLPTKTGRKWTAALLYQAARPPGRAPSGPGAGGS